jgi:KDO2-lipid IV(A) lauroyltransferase
VFQLARLGAGLIALLPIRWALALGRSLGRVARRFDGEGRRRAERQLVERLGVSEAEARRLSVAVYENAGMIAAEIAQQPRLSTRLADYVALGEEDRRILQAASEPGRGVIFVTGHVGNWELLAQRVALEGFDAVTLARGAPNPFLGAWIVERRRRGGLATINRGDPRAARDMLSAMKRGALLGVLLDQDTKVPSIHVPFFGAPASTPVAAAELALRRNAPIVTGFIRRRPDGAGHEVRLERFDAPESGDKAERVEAVTAALTKRIEDAIRASPAEWVWFHARWKR